MKRTGLLFLITTFIFIGCDPKEEKKKITITKKAKPKTEVSYQFAKSKNWLQQHKDDAVAMRNILLVNRADLNNLKRMDSILVPVNANADIASYQPFPVQLPAIEAIDKIIFFSYPTQSFAAYEKGELVYTGPTSMGRKADPTPPGLYFTNWKAEKTTSTFDDEWELKWNFNIENKEGIGWHEYELPGYPASHSCLRLLEADARYLYDWADQWVLDKDVVKKRGTPVVVFGSYDYKAPKPWLKLVSNPHALDIDAGTLEGLVSPYMKEIMDAQEKRNGLKKTVD